MFQLSAGGPALGLAFGMGTSFCLQRMYNEDTLEILLTVVAAYAAYIVADGLCGSSGVLAVATFGALFSHREECVGILRQGDIQSPSRYCAF